LEATKIQNVGKELGFSCLGNEEGVLYSLKCMEEKDNRKEGQSRGGLNVLDDKTD